MARSFAGKFFNMFVTSVFRIVINAILAPFRRGLR
jgi:hypothetical protein